MKTADDVAIRNIHDPSVKVLAVLETNGDRLPSHVLIRRLNEGMWYKGSYTEEAYQVSALAIGSTLAGVAYGDQKEDDWLIGFAIERKWLLTIAWHCFIEAILGWLRQYTKRQEGKGDL